LTLPRGSSEPEESTITANSENSEQHITVQATGAEPAIKDAKQTVTTINQTS